MAMRLKIDLWLDVLTIAAPVWRSSDLEADVSPKHLAIHRSHTVEGDLYRVPVDGEWERFGLLEK